MNVDKQYGNVVRFPGQYDEDEENGEDVAIEFDLEPGDEGYDEYGQEESEPDPDEQRFDGNLAEDIDPDELSRMGMDIMQDVEEDINSRSDWADTYKIYLKYLGIEYEVRSQPWPNACGVVHPGMLQGIVRFQSRALGKLFPSNGPCAISVLGIDTNPQLQLIITRAQALFNHHLTVMMSEMQEETDLLLFDLARIGFAVKKVYFDEDRLGRVCTQFIQAEDFIIPYGVTNIETSPRYSIEVRLSKNQVENLIIDRKYIDNLLPTGIESMGEIEQEKTELTGQDQEITVDDHLRFYEVYVDRMIPQDKFASEKGKRSPYIITIDKENEKIFAIYRDWSQNDERRKRKTRCSIYRYVPADGSYAYGLLHLTGGLIIAATRILRQLIDTGEIANIPAFFKSTMARIKSQSPLMPGEMRDIDIDPERLQQSFFSPPFKEPSQALLALLEILIGEIKSFSSTADLDISASSQNAPVGTTLALIERQTEISNAVQKRMHVSFSRELNLIAECMKEYQPEDYDKIFAELESAVGNKGVIVLGAAGDPTAATASQIVMQVQALIQASSQAPGVYDLAALHRKLASAMGMMDAASLVPDKSNVPEMGIVEENMNLVNNKPIKAYADQDHKSHIAAHMAFISDPMNQQILEKSPTSQAIVMAAYAHVAEHIAFDYRNDIEQQLGGQLPPDGQKLDPEVEQALSQLVAQAAARVKQAHDAMAQQHAAQQQAADPAYALEKRELDIKEGDVTAKHAIAAKKAQDASEQAERRDQIELIKVLTDAAKHDKDTVNENDRHAAELSQSAAEQAASIGSDLLQHAQHLDTQEQEQATQQAQQEHERGMQSDQQGHDQGMQQAQQSHEQQMQANAPTPSSE